MTYTALVALDVCIPIINYYTDFKMSFALLRSQLKLRPLHQINLLSRAGYHGIQKGQCESEFNRLLCQLSFVDNLLSFFHSSRVPG